MYLYKMKFITKDNITLIKIGVSISVEERLNHLIGELEDNIISGEILEKYKLEKALLIESLFHKSCYAYHYTIPLWKNSYKEFYVEDIFNKVCQPLLSYLLNNTDKILKYSDKKDILKYYHKDINVFIFLEHLDLNKLDLVSLYQKLPLKTFILRGSCYRLLKSNTDKEVIITLSINKSIEKRVTIPKDEYIQKYANISVIDSMKKQINKNKRHLKKTLNFILSKISKHLGSV